MIENQKTPETEPTTEAGRMLLAAFDNPTARTAILAIEAEAEARATVPDVDIERMAREHFEPRRHFFEPPDGDVCSECGEGPEQDFIRVTMHFTDGDA